MREIYAFRGFSLIEVLIVVALIGILSAIAIPAYDNYIIKTERKRAQLDLYQYQVYAEQYFTLNNAYPSDLASCSNCEVSEEYIYSIDNTGSGDDIYVLKATPYTTRQKTDSDCYTMVINAASTQSNEKNGTQLSNTNCWL